MGVGHALGWGLIGTPGDLLAAPHAQMWSTALRRAGLRDAELRRTAPGHAADSLFSQIRGDPLTVLGVGSQVQILSAHRRFYLEQRRLR
jgi:hypothetical protein